MSTEHFPSFAAAKMKYGAATQAMIDAGNVTIGAPKPKSRDDSDLHQHQMETEKEGPKKQDFRTAWSEEKAAEFRRRVQTFVSRCDELGIEGPDTIP